MNKHPNLKVRVVHGNTLTAAVILKEIPENVTEVFLTGATSKLGRVIALYLCRRQVRVLVSLYFVRFNLCDIVLYLRDDKISSIVNSPISVDGLTNNSFVY